METVGILEAGVPPAALAARFGRYDAMVRRMLGDGFTCRSYRAFEGELPARPEDHPAYVVTGSAAGVYDDLPWIAPLAAFLRAAHGRARLVGLCFGHQILAEALGGRVERSARGWGLGLHGYDVAASSEPWMDGARRIAVAASHQDQVVAPPPGAAVLASSPFTPYAALRYAAGEAVSFQFHPEFERGMAEALVEMRRDRLPDPAAADRMLASLEAPSDAERVGGWIRRFLG